MVLYSALGRLLETQQPPRWGEAAACYAVTRGLRPELGGALANALVNSGRAEEVRNGLALYAQLVREKPDNPWLHFRHGYALWSQQRFKEAEAACHEALRLKPDYPEAHNNLGNALDSENRHKEAEAEYREAIRLKPDDPIAHYNLGLALNGQGRHKEAEAEFREALRHNPAFPTAHIGLGSVLSRQGRHKEAEAACREASAQNPITQRAHNNLGNALNGQGRHKEAEAEFRQAIRLKPDDPISALQPRVGPQWPGPSQGGGRRLSRGPPPKTRLPRAHNNLGNALNGQGRHKEAEAEFREAIRLKPDDPISALQPRVGPQWPGPSQGSGGRVPRGHPA